MQELCAQTRTAFGRLFGLLQHHRTWSSRPTVDNTTGFLHTDQTGYKRGGRTSIGTLFQSNMWSRVLTLVPNRKIISEMKLLQHNLGERP